MRMLPRPSCPRAGQSGLWQNWSCGSIGDPHGARFDDHARRDAWWTRAFQAPTILITVPWGATPTLYSIAGKDRECNAQEINRPRTEPSGSRRGRIVMMGVGPPWHLPL